MVVDAKGSKVHEEKVMEEEEDRAEKALRECRHFMPVCWKGRDN